VGRIEEDPLTLLTLEVLNEKPVRIPDDDDDAAVG
jgi:hypothetical protein